MTDSMGPGKLVRHMQNPSYTYDKYLICIGLGPSMLSVICKNPSYSGPSYPSSPVLYYVKVINNIDVHDQQNNHAISPTSAKAQRCKYFLPSIVCLTQAWLTVLSSQKVC